LVYHIEGGTEAEGLEKRVLRKIFGPEKERLQGSGEDYITRSFMKYTSHQILFA
jgi:hypothetical protein